MSDIKSDVKEKIRHGGEQMRFSEDELTLLKNTFKDREDLLKLMRKFFLPTFEPDAPLGQMTDLYFSLGADGYKEMPAEDVKTMFLARNYLVQHIEAMLVMLSVLVHKKEETPEERAKRLDRDSTK